MLELTKWICARAKQLGGVAAGVTTLDAMDPTPFQIWLESGYAADMTYLHRHRAVRSDLGLLLPGARTAVCVAFPYPTPSADPLVSLLAGYARGRDYHTEVRERLRQLWNAIHERLPDGVGHIFVDDGPLPERELARRAGLGWVGSHACLITSQAGSRIVLGEILTTLPLQPTPPISGTCGACQRCLHACPTGALIVPGVVDARRCLAYWTNGTRGAIPLAMRASIGVRLFGCDTCQDVCPHNPAPTQAPPVNVKDLISLLQLTPDVFHTRFNHTPLVWLKRGGVLRNVCVVLGNLGDAAAIPALTATLCDADPIVREHATWALSRLRDGNR